MGGAARRSGGRTSGRGALGLLLGLTAYLPLEEFLLRWVPVDATGIALLRLAPEVLLLGALVLVWAGHRARGLRFARTPIDAALALFLILALTSTALSEGDLVRGLANLRVLVRYAAVFYLVVALAPDARERGWFLALLWGGALFQAGLGLAQYAAGGASELWLPRQATLELAGVRREFTALTGGIERGAALGTTAHPVAFALFLLAGGLLAAALALLAPRGRRFWPGLTVLACGLGLACSFSRASTLAYGLGLALLLWLLRREPSARRLLALGLVLAPAALALVTLVGPRPRAAGAPDEKQVAVGALTSFESLASGAVLERARRSRLWVLEDVGRAALASAGWIGHGPDEQHAKERLGALGGAALHRLVAYRAFEDVYWIALLTYYGFLGLAALAWLLSRLGASARELARRAAPDGERSDRALALAALVLLVVALPLTFVVRTFEFRTFAFAFWLLFGLVTAAAQQRARSSAARASGSGAGLGRG